MSANELLEQVKALSRREREKFFERIQELEAAIELSPVKRKNQIRQSGAAARRRKIMGDKTLPNLVLLARDAERY